MMRKILKKDVMRNKVITLILLVFVTLSSLLIASASSIIIHLTSSMNGLFEKSHAPHFVQMHAGEINQREIDTFVANNPLIKSQQTVEMINVNGSNLFLRNTKQLETDSVMDISFVRQNKSFDFLLDIENKVAHISKGKVGVPIYYMQQYNLQIGDTIRIANEQIEIELTIDTFIRDVQMNPSIVSSKRFVLHDTDWHKLKKHLGENEYLIEFQLHDQNKISELETLYASSNLPQKGPTITYSLFQTMNAITDGIVAIVIIFISILLITIALLCIRFILIATIDEDYREIGGMKATGIPTNIIQRIYLIKYVTLAMAAGLGGYILSLLLNPLLTANIILYMGASNKTLLHYVIPFLSTVIVSSIIILYCRSSLRKIHHLTTIEALKISASPTTKRKKKRFQLHKNIHLSLGLKDVLERMRMYGLLCFVYVIATFIIIVPSNLLNTVQSPDFIRYMGAGKSDIRIDLQQSNDVSKRFKEMLTYMEQDSHVTKHTALVTRAFDALNSDGSYDKIHVEVGDFTLFPLHYTKGTASQHSDEIALSSMNAKELKKDIGDTIILLVDGKKHELTVCGIYQDITNGGKTAKARISSNTESVLWYTINVNIKADIELASKIEEYKKAFYPAKVTSVDNYVSQTLGATIQQLKLITTIAIVISLTLTSLITTLFLKMLLVKDSFQIKILKQLGLSSNQLRLQYMIRLLFVLLIAITLGIVSVSLLGSFLISGLGSFMGASHITLLTNPFSTYIISPLALFLSVTTVTLIGSSAIKNINRMKE